MLKGMIRKDKWSNDDENDDPGTGTAITTIANNAAILATTLKMQKGRLAGL